MSTFKDLNFHVGETWTIDCELKGRDNESLPIPDGTSVTFKVTGHGITKLYTFDNYIFPVDRLTGKVKINIPANSQTDYQGGKDYQYELRVVQLDSTVSTQAYGSLRLKKSLFP